MKLKEKIDIEIKNAMLSKDSERLRALRGIKTLIMLAETEKGKSGELTSEREIEVLKKAAKQRRESLEIFTKEGRSELADKESSELKVIEEFLPSQMDSSLIETAIKVIITSNGYSSMKEMGLVIKEFNSLYPGQDGKVVSSFVKTLLS